jgi:hypothetical protein
MLFSIKLPKILRLTSNDEAVVFTLIALDNVGNPTTRYLTVRRNPSPAGMTKDDYTIEGTLSASSPLSMSMSSAASRGLAAAAVLNPFGASSTASVPVSVISRTRYAPAMDAPASARTAASAARRAYEASFLGYAPMRFSGPTASERIASRGRQASFPEDGGASGAAVSASDASRVSRQISAEASSGSNSGDTRIHEQAFSDAQPQAPALVVSGELRAHNGPDRPSRLPAPQKKESPRGPASTALYCILPSKIREKGLDKNIDLDIFYMVFKKCK